MKIISVSYMASKEEANDFIGRITGVEMIALKSPTQLRWYSKFSDDSKEIVATWKRAGADGMKFENNPSKLGTMEVNIRFVPRDYVPKIKEIL